MYFRYNDCISESQRLVMVAYEITSEYKNITKKQALMIAQEEEVITYKAFNSYKKHAISVKRLYSILYYLQGDLGNTLEYNHAYRDLLEEYQLYNNKVTMNKKDPFLYKLVKKINDYTNGIIDKIPSIKQVEQEEEELRVLTEQRENYERMHTMEYKPNSDLPEEIRINEVKEDIIRGFPGIPPEFALFVAKKEPAILPDESKIYQEEIKIIRLINIMEDARLVPKLDFVYNRAFDKLKESDQKLKDMGGFNHNSIACLLMMGFNAFIHNPDRPFPSYNDIKEKIESTKK